MIERAIKRFRESREARRWVGERIFHLLAEGVEIKGLENLSKPPYIIAFNHMGWAEGPVLSFYLSDLPHVMAKVENMEMGVIGPFAREMGYFPVRRGEFDRQAIRTTLRLLREGKVVAMAPEGTRGRGEERMALKPARPGIVNLARRAEVPIAPIAIWGTEGIWPLLEERKLPLSERFSLEKVRIHVSIGKPFEEHLSLERPLTSKNLMPCAHALMIKIRDLLPEEYHGCYANWVEQREE